MRRSVVFTATALVAGAVYIGCTQDFDQFEPEGATFTTSSGTGGTGGTGVTASTAAALVGSGTGAGGNGGTGGTAVTASSSSSGIPGGCMSDADCQPSTFCKTWECSAGLCSFTDTNAGTPLPQQTDNDCKVAQCDGSGQEETVADPGDTPTGDGNPCTDDTCNGDMPEHPPRPAGTPCMGNNMCDGNGNCV